MCTTFFQTGRCTAQGGQSCFYAHSQAELRTSPEQMGMMNAMMPMGMMNPMMGAMGMMPQMMYPQFGPGGIQMMPGATGVPNGGYKRSREEKGKKEKKDKEPKEKVRD